MSEADKGTTGGGNRQTDLNGYFENKKHLRRIIHIQTDISISSS